MILVKTFDIYRRFILFLWGFNFISQLSQYSHKAAILVPPLQVRKRTCVLSQGLDRIRLSGKSRGTFRWPEFSRTFHRIPLPSCSSGAHSAEVSGQGRRSMRAPLFKVYLCWNVLLSCLLSLFQIYCFNLFSLFIHRSCIFLCSTSVSTCL